MKRSAFIGIPQLDSYQRWWPYTYAPSSLAWGTLYRMKGVRGPRISTQALELGRPISAAGRSLLSQEEGVPPAVPDGLPAEEPLVQDFPVVPVALTIAGVGLLFAILG